VEGMGLHQVWGEIDAPGVEACRLVKLSRGRRVGQRQSGLSKSRDNFASMLV